MKNRIQFNAFKNYYLQNYLTDLDNLKKELIAVMTEAIYFKYKIAHICNTKLSLTRLQ